MSHHVKILPVLFFIVASLATFELCSSVAFAYIDPGTGSVIYTSIATIIGIGVGVLGALLWPVKRLIRRFRGRSNGSSSSDGQSS
jgi:hypothetical protein